MDEILFEDFDVPLEHFSDEENEDLESEEEDLSNASPLHKAIHNGDIDQVKEILNSETSKIEDLDESFQTKLFFLASLTNCFDIATISLTHGADINAFDKENDVSVLNYACEYGNEEAVEYLLKHKANVDFYALDEAFFSYILAKKEEHQIAWTNLIRLIFLYGYVNNNVEFEITLEEVMQPSCTNESERIRTFKEHFKTFYFYAVKDIEELKKLKINHKYNMLDFLFMSERMLSRYVNHEVVKAICLYVDDEEENLYHYKNRILNQYQKGLAEKELLGVGKESLQYLIKFNLPELCWEELLIYLNQKDVMSLIESRELNSKESVFCKKKIDKVSVSRYDIMKTYPPLRLLTK